MQNYDWLRDEPAPGLVRTRRHLLRIIRQFQTLIRKIDAELRKRKGKGVTCR